MSKLPVSMFYCSLNFLGNWKPLLWVRTILQNHWRSFLLHFSIIQALPELVCLMLLLFTFIFGRDSSIGPITIGLHKLVPIHQLLLCECLFVVDLLVIFRAFRKSSAP